MTETRDTYYQSHSKLGFIGAAGQAKLSVARVLVIGAGGLGCPCLQTLAGCGIGTLGIADFDTVSVSNLHRQILYSFDDVGKPKSDVAKARLQHQNPFIDIVVHNAAIDENNVIDIIKQYDLVVDGTDNFAVRYLINDACVYLNKPLIYGAIYQTEGHVTAFNYRGSATLRCLFPEPDSETHVPSCAEVGAYNVVTGIIGTLMANEVVKIVLDSKEALANKLLTFDALSAEMRTIGYKAKPESRDVSLKRFSQEASPIAISIGDFEILSPDSYLLIDVREDWEREERSIGGKHIPLNKLSSFDFSEIAKNEMVVVYCQSGARSTAAAQQLRKMGFAGAVSLKGGLNAIAE